MLALTYESVAQPPRGHESRQVATAADTLAKVLCKKVLNLWKPRR